MICFSTLDLSDLGLTAFRNTSVSIFSFSEKDESMTNALLSKVAIAIEALNTSPNLIILSLVLLDPNTHFSFKPERSMTDL